MGDYADLRPLLFFAVLLAVPTVVFPYAENGKFDQKIDSVGQFVRPFAKSMFHQTSVSLKISCAAEDKNLEIVVDWVLRKTGCADEYITLLSETEQTREERSKQYLNQPGTFESRRLNGKLAYCLVEWMSGKTTVSCDGSQAVFEEVVVLQNASVCPVEPAATSAASQAIASATAERAKRAAPSQPAGKPSKASKPATPSVSKKPVKKDAHVVAKTWEDGVYLFVVGVTPNSDNASISVEMRVEMKASYGYLSAADYPKRPFFGIMCLVYVIFGVSWLVALSCQWRDLLQIQFWIGGVIILGMLEKAVFYAEYETINSSGVSVPGAVLFAEIVSCAKRTLARMLVIIVSLGFGIVKPRLGPLLHRILLLGGVYFVLGSIEAGLRNFKHSADQSQQLLLAQIPLAVIDAGICWWVFTSLVQTMRTLRLRRNTTKLNLFRHLANVIVFSVLASVAFMIWSIRSHKVVECLTDWKELWVDEAFWHALFSILLAVIMVLWRPTANNQRYAFSALLDDAEDADPEEEPMMSEAYEGMKLRSHIGEGGGVKDAAKTVDEKLEEDLRWVEENIPTSVADAALPSLLDSDEEIMTTKFEMSKME